MNASKVRHHLSQNRCLGEERANDKSTRTYLGRRLESFQGRNLDLLSSNLGKRKFERTKNRLSWQDFNTSMVLNESRYYEILVRETHENGKPQPVGVAVWNPRGYLNNATHRVSI